MDEREETRRQELEADERSSEWPYASLLVVGVFGVRSPAAKKTLFTTTLALLLVVVSLLGLGDRIAHGVGDWVWAMVLPLAVAWIVWANVGYLRSLDELGRTLQLKAFALSYGAVMTLAAVLVGVVNAMTAAGGYATVDAHVFFLVLVLAEPIRGVALAVLARNYR